MFIFTPFGYLFSLHVIGFFPITFILKSFIVISNVPSSHTLTTFSVVVPVIIYFPSYSVALFLFILCKFPVYCLYPFE